MTQTTDSTELRQRAARELLRRRAAQSSLLEFTRYTKPDYRVNWHHQRIAAALDSLLSGEIKRLMIFCPPQHGKSELATRRLAAFALGRNPSCNVIQATYSARWAEKLCRQIQRIIDSPSYVRLFPDTKIRPWRIMSEVKRTGDEFEIVDHSGAYFGVGTGGGVSGRSCDLGIIDDPIEGAEQADSPAYRAKLWEWFNTDFMTRMSDDSRVVLMQTRWHRDDLAGRILNSQDGKEWDVVTIPAIRVDDSDPRDPREVGEALWPEFKSHDELSEIRRRSARTFYALYQQDPRAEGGTEWPAEYFNEQIWCDDWPERFELAAVSIDPSKGGQAKTHDYSAIVFAGVIGDVLYVDADLAKRNPSRIVDDLFGFVQRHADNGAPPDVIGSEAVQLQSILIDLIHERSSNYHGFHLDSFLKRGGEIIPMESGEQLAKKRVRIRRLTSLIINRKIRFKRTPGCRLLVDQLMDFPHADHDDGPDALEMAHRLLVDSSYVDDWEEVSTMAGVG